VTPWRVSCRHEPTGGGIDAPPEPRTNDAGEASAVDDALQDIESIREQLPIVERLVKEMGGAPVEKFKPSIRPVDRMLVRGSPAAIEPAPPIDDLERFLAQPGHGSPFSS
jgi:hypothetical protein